MLHTEGRHRQRKQKIVTHTPGIGYRPIQAVVTHTGSPQTKDRHRHTLWENPTKVKNGNTVRSNQNDITNYERLWDIWPYMGTLRLG